MRLYYDGLVVHQSHSDEGVIEVVDLGDTRSLHFGTFPRQSTMSMSTPYTLELSYTEAMMAALILNPNPKNILIIGLGGGSLVKFLLHYYPSCNVEVVEFRQDVIDIAQHYFSVPRDNKRLTIHKGDGYRYVQDRYYAAENDYDLLMVDAYDHVGMAASVGAQDFFDSCAGILSKQGVMSINLWGSDRALFGQSMRRINQSFDGKSMIVPVEDKGNIIGLATHQLWNAAALKKLKSQVEQQAFDLNINLPRSHSEMIRQNRSLISRLFS
jgi:spermidine synthase